MSESFDLLLLDVHMPEMDGFQVAMALREHERQTGGRLPVIALTARSRKEDREQCLAAGMDDFLAKPIRAAELWTAIDRCVGHGPTVNEFDSQLLAPNALLAACGGDNSILESICRAFKNGLPDLIAHVLDSFRNRDSMQLREAAHELSGVLAAFSTIGGNLASKIEDLAATAQLEECRPMVDDLVQKSQEIVRQIDGITIEQLHKQASQFGSAGE